MDAADRAGGGGPDRPGTLHWSCGDRPSGSISYCAIMSEPGEERLELSFWRSEGDERELVRQAIRLCHTAPHYGGKRWWMICPYRGIRAGKLYKPAGGDRFASRQAWRLGYHIQRVGRQDRAGERLFRFQRRLGCDQGVGAFPVRPKGMWQRTWQRHLAHYWELEEAADAELAMALGRIMGRLR